MGDLEAGELPQRSAAAHAKLQSAIGNDVHGGVGLRKLERIVEREDTHGDAEVDAFGGLRPAARNAGGFETMPPYTSK